MIENPPTFAQVVTVVTTLIAVAGAVLGYLTLFRKPPPTTSHVSIPPLLVPPNGNPRVLIVDDDRQFATCLALALNGDYDVTACTRPVDAERAISEARHEGKPFSVALIDYNLPQWPGTDIIRTLRVNQPQCYVILISGAFVDDGEDGKPDTFWLKDPLKVGKWKSQIDALMENS